MADRHARKPITWRPSGKLGDRLDAYVASSGRPVRAVIADAVEQLLDELAPDELAELADFNRSARQLDEPGRAAARYAAGRLGRPRG